MIDAPIGEDPFLTEFLVASDMFFDGMIGVCKDNTKKENWRKLHRYGRTLAKLRHQGRIASCDPSKLTERDIRVFVEELRVEGLQTSTITRALNLLNSYLSQVGNTSAVLVARKKLKISPPTKDVHVLSERELSLILDVVIRLSGWRMEMMKGVIAIAVSTGIRPGEIITLHLDDVNLEMKSIHVREPKGNGKYQDPHTVKILRDDLIPWIDHYLAVRYRHLMNAGVDSNMLFPNLRNPGEYSYSDKSLRASMRKVSAICGFPFTTKTFRATFCTLILDRDYNQLPAVSAQLGHLNTETTRKFYYSCKRSPDREATGLVYNSIELPDMGRDAEAALKRARDAGLLKHQG